MHYSDAYGLVVEANDAIERREKEQKYQEAIIHYKDELFDLAQTEFLAISDYENSKEYLDIIGDFYLKMAEENLTSENYSGCLDYLDKINGEDKYPSGFKNVNDMRTRLFEKYKEFIEKKANAILATDGYQAMVDFLKDVDYRLISSDQVNALIDRYKPVPLSSISWYHHEMFNYVSDRYDEYNYDPYFTNDLEDEFGDSHNNCLSGGGSLLKFHLGKSYHYLTGIVFVVKGTRATEERPVYLEVTDDKGNVLFKTEHKSGFPNESFSVDVSELDDVIIKFDAESSYNAGGMYYTFFGAVGELSLIP